MYEIIKQVILNGGYKLSEVRKRIMKLYALGEISESQLDELLTLASERTSADAERPEVLAILSKLNERYADLNRRLSILESSGGECDAEANPDHIYPAWEPWDGISNNYQYEQIVQYGDKLWKSTYEGHNVWEPGAPGVDERYWIEYVSKE